MRQKIICQTEVMLDPFIKICFFKTTVNRNTGHSSHNSIMKEITIVNYKDASINIYEYITEILDSKFSRITFYENN